MKLPLFIPRVSDMKLSLAEYVFGRVLLHLGCALRGGNVRFHLAGIRREVGKLASTWRYFKWARVRR